MRYCTQQCNWIFVSILVSVSPCGTWTTLNTCILVSTASCLPGPLYYCMSFTLCLLLQGYYFCWILRTLISTAMTITCSVNFRRLLLLAKSIIKRSHSFGLENTSGKLGYRFVLLTYVFEKKVTERRGLVRGKRSDTLMFWVVWSTAKLDCAVLKPNMNWPHYWAFSSDYHK